MHLDAGMLAFPSAGRLPERLALVRQTPWAACGLGVGLGGGDRGHPHGYVGHRALDRGRRGPAAPPESEGAPAKPQQTAEN